MFWTYVWLLSGFVMWGGFAFLYFVGRAEWRALPADVAEQIQALPQRRANQHTVDLELADGRTVRHVWIAWGRYPAMVGGKTIVRRYRPSQVVRATASN